MRMHSKTFQVLTRVTLKPGKVKHKSTCNLPHVNYSFTRKHVGPLRLSDRPPVIRQASPSGTSSHSIAGGAREGSAQQEGAGATLLGPRRQARRNRPCS